MMTPLVPTVESLSSTHAPAPGCPGDVTVTGQGTATSSAPQHWDTQPLPAASLCLLLPGSSLWEDLMNLNIYPINRKCSCFPLLNLALHYLQSILTSKPLDWILASQMLKGFNLRGRAQGRAASDWNGKKLLWCLLGKKHCLDQEIHSSCTEPVFWVGGV